MTKIDMLAPASVKDGVTRVSVLGRDSIVVGHNLTQYLVDDILSQLRCSTLVVITDRNLANLHLDGLVSEFNRALSNMEAGPRLLTHIIAPGELSKSRASKASIEDFLLGAQCTRDTCLIGLGGGVIGDLVGFVASTFMRGVPVIHIPTTLLAMVDSSIGGKTAIDTRHGKNLIGTFWQPTNVYVDIAYLSTLPVRELSNGLAEIIKTAVISNTASFEALETHSIDKLPQPVLENIVIDSIRFKAYVVTQDEREGGLRGLLNFGHTIGHAIEGNIAPHLLHGECVAIGMVMETEVARSLNACTQATLARLTRVLKLYNLPTALYGDPWVTKYVPLHLQSGDHFKVARLMEVLSLDKKNIGSTKRMVVLSGIGSTRALSAEPVADEEFIRAMAPSIKINQCINSSPKDVVSIMVPGSKSISNRALLLAALGKGTCRLKGLLHSDDTQVMLEALRLMGNLEYTWEEGGATLVLEGCDGVKSLVAPAQPLYLGNAGTASRFLTSLCGLVPCSDQPITLTGNQRMQQRPIGPLVKALRDNGCSIEYGKSEGCPPLIFNGNGRTLKGGLIELAADVSSQYVSSILMASPLMPGGVRLRLVGGHVISQLYIDMTIAMMQQFGVKVTRLPGQDEYIIEEGGYTNPKEYLVEGDASSATYPLAWAAMTGLTCQVTNLGSNSLQGDARFAKDVLEPMGCHVVQTEMTTTVTGPVGHQLKPLPAIDMEPMTDAFLTASVLAAVANGTTSIHGIANQRVKECDRIAAMVSQLSKFGVEAHELPDGLSIKGITGGRANLKCPVGGVDCYDDHRVAMSFSLLGCAVPGTILLEKYCVGKTWPNWWDVLRHDLKVELTGVDQPIHAAVDTINDSNGSVVLIGMRGVGKTTLGRLLAAKLGWKFLDLDEEFLKFHKVSDLGDYIAQTSWDQFRKMEHELLARTLNDYPHRTVISCGGGIVELESNRKLLTSYYNDKCGPVVHLRRDIKHIVDYLTKDVTRPKYSNNEGILEVWARREPLYDQCSNQEFVIPKHLNNQSLISGEEVIAGLIGELFHLVNPTSKLPSKNSLDPTYFLCLTYPYLTPKLAQELPSMVQNCHAVELRVDLLAPDSPPNSEDPAQFLDHVRNEVAYLKLVLGPKFPIIYTLRTTSEGGSFPDNSDAAEDLLRLGSRMGCAVIDVQLGLLQNRPSIADNISLSKASSLLVSYHDLSGEQLDWDSTSTFELIQRMHYYRPDIIKLVSNSKNNLRLEQLIYEYNKSHEKNDAAPPLIAINMGRWGQETRIKNHYLTPVTHPKLPKLAAPGQLSVSEIQQARQLLGKLPPRTLYLLGSPISHSPSPQLHTYLQKDILGLPHQMIRHELDDSDSAKPELSKLLKHSDFGGACVTIPLKVAVIDHLDEVRGPAKLLGAVNTVVKECDGKLVGYNTDWLGIKGTVEPKLPSVIQGERIGLVLGAGGTARAAVYALAQLNFSRILVYNRSSNERLTQLVHDFAQGGISVTSIVGLPELQSQTQNDLRNKVHALVDTLPGAANLCDSVLLETLLVNDGVRQGVHVSLAYTKYPTCDSAGNEDNSEVPQLIKDNQQTRWGQVDGLSILVEQARYQFQLFGGNLPQLPPTDLMLRKVYQTLAASQDS